MELVLWFIFGLSALPLFIIGGVLIRGRGGSLLAGYNTKTPQERTQYDEKALLRFSGWGIIFIAVCTLLVPPGIRLDQRWIMWVGIILMTAIPIFMAIYCNTGGRFRRK